MNLRRLSGLAATLLMTLVLSTLALAGPAQADVPRAQSPAAAASFGILQNLSGLCVQPSPADPTGIGVQLVLATCDSNNQAQHWATVLVGGGKYRLLNQATGGCMDAHGPYVSGTPVDTWFCGNISNQVWADGPPSPSFPNYSQVRIAAKTELCLAPDGPYGQIGVALVLRPCNGLDFRQYWFGG